MCASVCVCVPAGCGGLSMSPIKCFHVLQFCLRVFHLPCQVEAMAKKRFASLPLVLQQVEHLTHTHALLLSAAPGQVSTGVGQLSAVTMQAVDHVVVLPWRASSEQVQLCEWRQFMDHLAKATRSIRITQVRGASRVRATGWCFCAD